MSTQRGNVSRTRGQKYKNATAFSNTRYDTSQKTKAIIKNTKTCTLCQRCSDIIQWKIKYKKYKPLTQAKKCNKCGNKTVKAAYHTICDPCAVQHQICGKCGEKSSDPIELPKTQSELALEENEQKKKISSLPERKRRTLMRYMENKGKGKTEKVPVTLNSIQSKLDSSDFDSDLDDLADLDDLNLSTEDDDNDDFSENEDD